MSEKLINLDNLAYYDGKIKSYIAEQIATGGVQYLGVVDSLAELNALTAGYGDYARVGTAFTFNSDTAHIGDLFIKETSGWILIHCHTDTDTNTKYTLSKSGNTITLTSNDGSDPSSVEDGGGELDALVSLAGKNKKTLNIGECTADDAADYAIVGGTNDKTVISNILGSLASTSVSIAKPIINADCGISFGSGTIVNSTGGNAIGVWNTSGVKGYYWDEINFDNKTITISSTRRSSTLIKPTEQTVEKIWDVGDRVSLVNDNKYPAFAEITKVEGNIITVDNLPFDKVNYEPTLLGAYAYGGPDDRTIFACYEKEEVSGINSRWYPHPGAIELGWAGTAFGVENLVTGSGGFVGGWNNWQAGDFGATFGRDNISGYASLVAGMGNDVPAQVALVAGSSNKVNSQGAIVGGSGSTVVSGNALVGGANHSITDGSSCTVVGGDGNILTNSWCAAVFGNGNTTTSQNCLVAGIKNNVQGANSLVVGNTNSTVTGNSVMSGYNNKLFASSSGSIVTGEGNKVGETKGSPYNAVFGFGNTSNEQCNIIAGRANTADGKNSAIFGQDNTSATSCDGSAIFGNANAVGSNVEVTSPDGKIEAKTGVTNSAAFGSKNKVYASNVIVAGNGNTAWNGNSAVFGYNNSAQSAGTLIAGDGNIATAWDQVVVGRYNVTNTDDLLVIGNGSNLTQAKYDALSDTEKANWVQETTNTGGVVYTKRSNALRVTSKGDVITAGKITAGAAPTADMDVVTLKYFNENKGGADTDLTTIVTNQLIVNAQNSGSNKNTVADHSAAIGQRLTVNNQQSLAVGYQNTNSSSCTITAGTGLTVTSYCGAAFGSYNKTTNALLVVGKGSSGSPSDAFIVNTDGRATIGAAPTGDMDVVNLAYLRDHLLNKAW